MIWTSLKKESRELLKAKLSNNNKLTSVLSLWAALETKYKIHATDIQSRLYNKLAKIIIADCKNNI